MVISKTINYRSIVRNPNPHVDLYAVGNKAGNITGVATEYDYNVFFKSPSDDWGYTITPDHDSVTIKLTHPDDGWDCTGRNVLNDFVSRFRREFHAAYEEQVAMEYAIERVS